MQCILCSKRCEIINWVLKIYINAIYICRNMWKLFEYFFNFWNDGFEFIWKIIVLLISIPIKVYFAKFYTVILLWSDDEYERYITRVTRPIYHSRDANEYNNFLLIIFSLYLVFHKFGFWCFNKNRTNNHKS